MFSGPASMAHLSANANNWTNANIYLAVAKWEFTQNVMEPWSEIMSFSDEILESYSNSIQIYSEVISSMIFEFLC